MKGEEFLYMTLHTKQLLRSRAVRRATRSRGLARIRLDMGMSLARMRLDIGMSLARMRLDIGMSLARIRPPAYAGLGRFGGGASLRPRPPRPVAIPSAVV